MPLGHCISAYCATQYCDDLVEETCFLNGTAFESCALIEDGGCPCPEGQVKCGRYFYLPVYVGFCASICCDDLIEETCYSELTGEPESCALISEGGCPCPEGQIKCGAFLGYAGKIRYEVMGPTCLFQLQYLTLAS